MGDPYPEKEKLKERIKDEEEDPDDFDLISDYGKENDESTLTDEDIFEKILKDDERKGAGEDSFEILGKKGESLDYPDQEFEMKRKEDENFYSKFLKSDKLKFKSNLLITLT